MAKTYTELEAWAIFAGALIIGIVLTSVFWAYITIPKDAEKTEKGIVNSSVKNLSESVTIPSDFITFCKTIDAVPNWDNSGFRQCTLADNTSEKNLIVMKFLCKKFNLTLSYGSFGVKCEGKV